MARVTVEDCIEKIPNRFDLVLIAAQRARGISSGNALTIERDNDKNPVVSLREIAEETIDIDEMGEDLIKSLQRMRRREEEQSTADEAASLAQEDMAAFAGDSGFADEASASSGGMTIGGLDDDADSDASHGGAPDMGSFADEGSFSDEGKAEQ